MQYESGNMSPSETLKFFGELIRDGTCWHLQGCYGRQANDFIQNGLIDDKGNITEKARNLLAEGEE
jgi:hypothetical protein